MTDKLEDTSLRLKDEMDLYKKMMDKLKQNRHQFQKEKDAMQEVGGRILCNQTHTARCDCLLCCSFSFSVTSLSQHLCQLIHLHLQYAASAHYITFFIRSFCAA